MSTNKRQLIIFLKSPIEGNCKTRLIPLLGQKKATEFYKSLVIQLFQQINSLQNTDIAVYCYPDTRHSFIQQLHNTLNISLYCQQGNSLGEKMYNALQHSLQSYSQSLLIGTDCPVINTAYLETAFASLNDHDIALGPAEDGGYVLIGGNKISADIFDNIDWSTDKVLQQQLSNCRDAGYTTYQLNTLWDIDTPQDLIQYQSQILPLLHTIDYAGDTMDHHEADNIRNNVRDSYSKVAEAENQGDCCGVETSCCGVSDDAQINQLISTRLGYSEDDLNNVPAGADMGLGCGNPNAIAALQKGETVVDLGSGGGFDSFLAANEVGDTGHVIGIDMTPEMISKARKNAAKANYKNVEFRLGEIEHLPVADDSIDTIMSNCVINLSPDKQQVFNDAYRILKPGGRLAISDVVSSVELPDAIKNDTQLYSACVSGASSINTLQLIMQQAGFKEIKIQPKDESREFIKDWAPGSNIEDYVVSATIQATK